MKIGMRKITLILGLLMILMSFSILSACDSAPTTSNGTTSGTTTGGTTSGTTTGSTTTSSGDVSLLYDTMTEWTVMTTDFVNAPTSGDLPGYKGIAEKFNVQMVFTLVNSADYNTRLNLELSSGNPPYLIWAGDPMVQYYGTGAVVDLTEYIDAGLAPNFLAKISEDPAVQKNFMTDDGKYYSFRRLQGGFDPLQFAIYTPWLKTLNLDMPETTDELYETLKAMKTLDPKIIPWTRGQWHTGAHSLEGPIYQAFGTSSSWFHFAIDEYVFGPYERQDEMKEALKYLNKLYSEGIIDQEYLSVDHDAYMAKLSNGEVGLVYGWFGGTHMSPVDENGNWVEPFDWEVMPVVAGPSGIRVSEALDAVGPGMHVMSSHPDPDKAVILFDWLYSDEGIEFTNWGIKDLTYTVENDTYAYTDMIMKHEAGIMNGMRSNGFFMNNFTNVVDPEALAVMFSSNMTRGINANLPFARAQNPLLTPSDAERDIERQMGADIMGLVDEMLPQFVVGRADVDTQYDAFITNLEQMGVKDYIANRRAQYDRWKNR